VIGGDCRLALVLGREAGALRRLLGMLSRLLLVLRGVQTVLSRVGNGLRQAIGQ
jgi:hypothetical protein